MLQAANEDARSNAQPLRKVADFERGKVTAPDKRGVLVLWDQEIGSEGIGVLLGCVTVFEPFDEDAILDFLQDVAGFVEKAEPKMVVRFVEEAELNERLVFGQPVGCAAHAELSQLRGEDKRHACLGAQCAHLGLECFRIGLGQGADFFQCRAEFVGVERLRLNFLRVQLAFAQPRGNDAKFVAREFGFAEADGEFCPAGCPAVGGGDAEKGECDAHRSGEVVASGNPSLLDQLFVGDALEPVDIRLELFLLLLACEEFLVVGVEVEPERGGGAEGGFQLHGGFRRDGGDALDDLVDGFAAQADAVSQFNLRHAQGVQRLGQRIAGRSTVLRCVTK